METREQNRESLEARLAQLERRLDQLRERAVHDSADAQARLHSMLNPLHTRLIEIRRRLREKEDADNRAQDAALAELNHAINDIYDGMMSGPK